MAAGSICIRNDERGRWHSVWPRCRDIGHLLTLRATRRTLPASRLLLCHRGTNPPPRATLRSVCVCVSVCVQLCAIPCATARPLNDHPQLSPSFTVLRLRDPLLPTLHCSVCIRCWNTFSLSLSLSLSLSVFRFSSNTLILSYRCRLRVYLRSWRIVFGFGKRKL